MKRMIMIFMVLMSFMCASCQLGNKKPNETPKVDYSITFDIMGHGTLPEDINNVTKIPFYLPKLTDDEYEFIGWYYDKDFTDKVILGEKIESNVTLYAKWELIVITYSITFDALGYSDNPEKILEATTILELPQLSSDSYEFAGWFYDRECKSEAQVNDILTSDVILYAKWTKSGSFDTPLIPGN